MTEPTERDLEFARDLVQPRRLHGSDAVLVAEYREECAAAERARILDAVKAAANSTAPCQAKEMLLDAIAVLQGMS